MYPAGVNVRVLQMSTRRVCRAMTGCGDYISPSFHSAHVTQPVISQTPPIRGNYLVGSKLSAVVSVVVIFWSWPELLFIIPLMDESADAVE